MMENLNPTTFTIQSSTENKKPWIAPEIEVLPAVDATLGSASVGADGGTFFLS
jgi:hypothetical protein